MRSDDEIRSAVRDLTARTDPPPDLLYRALAQATRRHRWRIGLSAAGVCAALVAGSFAGAMVLDRSPGHRGATPADDPTTSVAVADLPPDLTGKALADALGLQVVVNCGASMQVTKDPIVALCLPRDWDETDPQVQIILLQLRGYERTPAMRAYAEQAALMLQFGRDQGESTQSWGDIADRYEDLKAELEAEQGANPENGFEEYQPTASPTTG